jgi:hypothetical protein
MSMKPGAPAVPPPIQQQPVVQGKPKTPLVSFAFLKKDGRYHAIALLSQGDKVIDQKCLESDDYRLVALDALEKAIHAAWHFDVSPFDSEKK